MVPKILPLSSPSDLDFRFGHHPKEVFLKTLRDHFGGQIGAFQSANDRADIVDRVGVAAQERGYADIAAHLHDFGLQALLTEKAALLGDVEIDGSDAPAGIGDNDSI